MDIDVAANDHILLEIKGRSLFNGQMVVIPVPPVPTEVNP